MDTELIVQCLKWGGLVLLAGFIGQFGRTLAQKMMSRKGRPEGGSEQESGAEHKSRPGSEPQSPPNPDGVSGAMGDKERYKQDKKRLKALKKAEKKGR